MNLQEAIEKLLKILKEHNDGTLELHFWNEDKQHYFPIDSIGLIDNSKFTHGYTLPKKFILID
ncbi:MAG: hypothetical protein ACFFDN_13995 [Candidatus Hodarchaeota archaeon]